METSDMAGLHWAGLSTEMTMLGAAMVLGLVHLLLAAQANNGERGPKWNLGPRDGEPPPVSAVAGRLERARVNFMETFPFFAAVVLALQAMDRHNLWTAYGAEVYVAARVIYLPLYGFGVFGLRTLVWILAMIGIVMLIASLFW